MTYANCCVWSLMIALIAILVSLMTSSVNNSNSNNNSKLPDELLEWKSRGRMHTVFDRQMFVVDSAATTTTKITNTIVFVHGFPTSSFDFRRVWDEFVAVRGLRVIAFDHVGFGFSDKPRGDEYSYSLHEQAEQMLQLLVQLNITDVHFVSHDMGDSVLTEVLTRIQRQLVPSRLAKDFVCSSTFTNGGMLIEHSNFRVTQSLLMRFPTLMSMFERLDRSHRAFRQQLASVWSRSPSIDIEQRDRDIELMLRLNEFNNGMALMGRLMGYLNDRYQFQSRWIASLSKSTVPIRFVWGDDDAVAPLIIADELHRRLQQWGRNVTRIVLKDVGHFGMLEQPKLWSKTILKAL